MFSSKLIAKELTGPYETVGKGLTFVSFSGILCIVSALKGAKGLNRDVTLNFFKFE